MNAARESLKVRLNDVFREVFADERLEIFDGMTAEDMEGWDSLKHITLVVAIEQEFGVTLNAAEIGELENVGSILDLLEERSAA